jgi:hypothetical protein
LDKKLYSSTERELVFHWSEKWIKLIGLINEVTGVNEPPWSPPPPTDLEELQYQSLRIWFIDHQAQFVPLWEDFYGCQEWASHQDYNNGDIADLKDIDKYLENPFLFFYKPENLYQLARQLDLQSGIDMWEPSEYRASMIRPVIIRMGRIMIEFMDWMSERTYESK